MQELIEVIFRSERIGYFINPKKLELQPDVKVIVRVDRGENIARIINCSFQSADVDDLPEKPGKILRIATEEDYKQLEIVKQKEDEASKRFKELLKGQPFEMKLIETIYQLDGNKLTFFFSAEGRVDFRELVKDLAREFRVRIELRQIGARDEAKLLGDLGMCGRPLCCRQHLWFFDPITMKMAKNQQTTLDPTKISGICGRLKCCLHYEDDFYSRLKKQVPREGLLCELTEDTKLLKTGMKVFVRNHRILANLVLVEYTEEDNKTFEWVSATALKWDSEENLYKYDDNVS